MTDTLGLQQGTLRLVPWSTTWPTLFTQEKARIDTAIAPAIARIEHIGSTSVPGLLSKPILDIAVMAPDADLPHIASTLVSLGYIDRGIRSGRLFIRLRDGDVRTHNLHLYALDDPEWQRHIAFRDALRSDAALRTAYAALKQDIATSLQGRRAGYADAKTEFIQRALPDHP